MSESPIRIAVFDIETTALDASYGRLLCACFKFSDEDEVRTAKAVRLKNERDALETIEEWWDEADIVVGWNSKLFDQPMLNARRMQYGMPPLREKKHIDLMYMSKKLRFRGNRLDGVSKDLRAEYAKYNVPAHRWVEAADGSKGAFDEIVHHCELDVLLTEEMLRIMKPLIVRITR